MSTKRSHPLLAAAAVATAGAVAAALALTDVAGAAPATGPLVRVSGTPVPDSWVVTLEDSAASPGEVGTAAASLASRYAGSLRFTYTRAARGFSVRMTEARARRLAADPRVASVRQDVRVRALGTETTDGGTWGLDRTDQRTLPLSGSYTYPTTATNVHAYVIDTGIRTAHTDFGGRATVGRDFVGDGRNGQDCDGHGTYVAGILGGSRYGVAKGVSLVAVRALDCAGQGTAGDVIAAVDWVTANAVRPAVANLSLGLVGVYEPLDAAVRNSVAAGVTYAVAAGNGYGDDACGHSPASTAVAITVGATTVSDARADFSDQGRCLDLFAPGEDITSAWNTSDTATHTSGGTSIAAPHAGGAAALYLAAHPTASPATVRNALVAAGTTGVVTDRGAGSPDVLLHAAPNGNPAPQAPPGATATATAPPTRHPGLPISRPTTPPPTTTPPTTPPPTTPPRTTAPATTAPATTAPPRTTQPAPPGGTGTTNGTDVPIPDLGTAESAIAVAGRPGQASGALRVVVRVVHSYRGDLAVDLLAPGGTTYRLKNSSSFDHAQNLEAVFTVNASAAPAEGTWRLRVRDRYAADTGYLDSWSLLF